MVWSKAFLFLAISIYSGLSKMWLIFKKFDVGGGIGYRYVDDHRNKLDGGVIRWETVIYCPLSLMAISGPSISNPSNELVEKIKAGDMSIPEPEKQVLDSIKCTEPKKK